MNGRDYGTESSTLATVPPNQEDMTSLLSVNGLTDEDPEIEKLFDQFYNELVHQDNESSWAEPISFKDKEGFPCFALNTALEHQYQQQQQQQLSLHSGHQWNPALRPLPIPQTTGGNPTTSLPHPSPLRAAKQLPAKAPRSSAKHGKVSTATLLRNGTSAHCLTSTKGNSVPARQRAVGRTADVPNDTVTAMISEYDVVLGDTHTPTFATEVYRQVRQEYAKRRIKPHELAQLKHKVQQQILLAKTTEANDSGHNLPYSVHHNNIPEGPTFWYSVKAAARLHGKIQPGSSHRYLPHRADKGPYAIATDQAIVDDVRNAPRKSRTRKLTPVFRLALGSNRSVTTLTGSSAIADLAAQAQLISETWMAGDAVKTWCVETFRTDLKRLVSWHQTSVTASPTPLPETLECTLASKGPSALQVRLQALHVQQLEVGFCEAVNRLGNDMVERYNRVQKMLSETHSSHPTPDTDDSGDVVAGSDEDDDTGYAPAA
jgi:hypothetical protein